MTGRDPGAIDLQTATRFQKQLLQGVSRTFALTIPQLPDTLEQVVTNAYLLCRIADTIEDDARIDAEQKSAFHRLFLDALEQPAAAVDFADRLTPRLAPDTLPTERELIGHTPEVLRVTRSFDPVTRTALQRCLTVMSRGMPEFARVANPRGLADLRELDRYCYFVAGVVGEMLTELFCQHAPRIAGQRERLMELAPSFGQGLQMTNILKDVWEDQRRGVCWLPRSVFEHGSDTGSVAEATFRQGLNHLLGLAHAHLRNGLSYTLLLPRRETGIRRFCLWALGLAILTLRKIHRNPGYRSTREVKVTRRTVRLTIAMVNASASHDGLLRWLFDQAARDLPLAADFSGTSLAHQARH